MKDRVDHDRFFFNREVDRVGESGHQRTPHVAGSSLRKELVLQLFPRDAVVRVLAVILEPLVENLFVPAGHGHLMRRKAVPETLDELQALFGRKLEDLLFAQRSAHRGYFTSPARLGCWRAPARSAPSSARAAAAVRDLQLHAVELDRVAFAFDELELGHDVDRVGDREIAVAAKPVHILRFRRVELLASFEKAKAWRGSPEYAEAKKVRETCARANMIVVEGV